MILSIGRQSRRHKKGFTPTPIYYKNGKSRLVWGFTFIELILTTLIIMIIIGLSTPLFRKTYYDLRVNLQTKDLASLMNLAREKAIMTRVPHIIKLDVDKNTYRMLTVDLEKDETILVEGKWGRRFHIASSLKVDSSKELIKFFPDGSSNGVSISLVDTSGSEAKINVNAGTGEITVGTEEEK